MFICTKFAQRHLSLDPPHSTLFVRKPIRLRGDFNGDLWSLGQHVLQLLSQLILQLGGQLIWAVGVVACVSLLPIRHREVLRAEGGVGLAATDAAVGSANRERSSVFTLDNSHRGAVFTVLLHQALWSTFYILELQNSALLNDLVQNLHL